MGAGGVSAVKMRRWFIVGIETSSVGRRRSFSRRIPSVSDDDSRTRVAPAALAPRGLVPLADESGPSESRSSLANRLSIERHVQTHVREFDVRSAACRSPAHHVRGACRSWHRRD